MEIRLNPVPAAGLLDPLRVGVQFGQDRRHRGNLGLEGRIDRAFNPGTRFLEDTLGWIELGGI